LTDFITIEQGIKPKDIPGSPAVTLINQHRWRTIMTAILRTQMTQLHFQGAQGAGKKTQRSISTAAAIALAGLIGAAGGVTAEELPSPFSAIEACGTKAKPGDCKKSIQGSEKSIQGEQERLRALQESIQAQICTLDPKKCSKKKD